MRFEQLWLSRPAEVVVMLALCVHTAGYVVTKILSDLIVVIEQ